MPVGPPNSAEASAECKQIWISSSKYGLICSSSKTENDSLKMLDTVAIYELMVEANPPIISSNFKYFRISSSTQSLLLAVLTDREKEEWIKYFNQIKLAIGKKISELREKFAAERRLADSKLTKIEKIKSDSDIRQRSKTVDAKTGSPTPVMTSPNVGRVESPGPKIPTTFASKLKGLGNSSENVIQANLAARKPAAVEMQGFMEVKRSQVSEWHKRWVVLLEKGKIQFFKSENKEELDSEMNLECYCPIAEASSSSHSNCVALIQTKAMCVVSVLPEDLQQWMNAFNNQGIVQNIEMLRLNSIYFTNPDA